MSDLPKQPASSGVRSAHAQSRSSDVEPLKSATVMMVDDEPITLDVVQAFLEDVGYRRFITISEPTEAMAAFAAELPDVLLLDLMMPEVNGFDILREIRADARYQHIPVIVLTSSTDGETKLKALELGATDFLAKPVDASELVLRLRNTLAAKAYLDRLASFDPLTGLYNRQMFGDHIDWTLRLAQRQGRTGALLHINVDRFRKINEALGPALGDEFLQAIAQRLEQGVRASDTVARIGGEADLTRLSRLGGDEFGVLLVEVDKSEHIIAVARRCLETMAGAFRIGGHEVYMTCSIGIAVFPDDGVERDTLVQRAGVALKFAKKQGGNTYCFYSAELNDRSLQLLSLTGELRKAISEGELRLYFQPKVDAQSSALVGAEALVRWMHPGRGLVSPGEFIPVAEETGLIVDMGLWVLREACKHIQIWFGQGLMPPPISVNISGRQFAHPDFVQALRDILQDSALDRQYLQLELTESVLMHHLQDHSRTLNQIHDLGLKLSLDDFGTGYSSLSYLSRFPIDELKIDQSFVRRLSVQGVKIGGPIVVAIIAMARALHMQVVAEGVENDVEATFLREQGCHQLQGYFFGKPMPAEEFAKRLAARSAGIGVPPTP